jgi:hypothetical protein
MKTGRNRVGAFVVCLLAGLGLGRQNGTAAEVSGLIGLPLSEAQAKSDLFAFFHFVPVGPEVQNVTTFKPTGEAFRPLVTLKVTTGSGGIIQSLQLLVARSFIDDPKRCVYAADLAKSFLLDAAAPSDVVSALAREIDARSMARAAGTILTAQPLPDISAPPSPAYKTYTGDAQPQELSYSSGDIRLSLHNTVQGSEPVLDLTVAGSP